MHEFALANSMCRIVLESAEAHHAVRVLEVRCRIGALRQIVPALMHTAFEACCQGTLAEGAKLVIEIDPVEVTCGTCGKISRSERMIYECPQCNAVDISTTGGTDMTITSIDIDQEDDHGDCRPAQRAGA